MEGNFVKPISFLSVVKNPHEAELKDDFNLAFLTYFQHIAWGCLFVKLHDSVQGLKKNIG